MNCQNNSDDFLTFRPIFSPTENTREKFFTIIVAVHYVSRIA